MSDLNQCSFIGRLGADPEVKTMQNGNKLATMRLAVSETWRDKQSGERKEKTEWVSVVVMSEALVKIVEAYASKGSRLYVQGKMQTRKWQDQSGNDRYSTEIVLSGYDAKIQLLDSASDSPRQSSQREPEASHGSMGNALSDDIPFSPEWRG